MLSNPWPPVPRDERYFRILEMLIQVLTIAANELDAETPFELAVKGAAKDMLPLLAQRVYPVLKYAPGGPLHKVPSC